MTATGLVTSTAGRGPGPWRTPDRLPTHAVVTAAVFACYIVGRLFDGPVAALFAIVGASACGWAWLLARALFDPARHDAWWPRVTAVTVMATGAVSTLATGDGLVSRVADNAYVLSGSAALLLTFVEPFNRYRRDLPGAEKGFRFAFLAVYGLLVAVSILDFRTPGVVLEADLVKGACALAGLVAAMAATGFRLRHPLTSGIPAPAVRRAPTTDDARLAEQLLRLLQQEALHLEPDIRIGEVAARLGQPEYRISQCIPASLGFRNFNRFINHHRVERAKRLLADAGDDRSILAIAFECGFASVGPFNRAFKDEVGVTPRAFRQVSRRPGR